MNKQTILVLFLTISFSFFSIQNEEKTIATIKGNVTNEANPDNIRFIETIISDNIGTKISSATTNLDGEFLYYIDLSKLNNSELLFSIKQHKLSQRILLKDSSFFRYSDSLIIKLSPAKFYTKSEYTKYIKTLPKLPRI